MHAISTFFIGLALTLFVAPPLRAQAPKGTNASVMQTLVSDLDDLIGLILVKGNDDKAVTQQTLTLAAKKVHRTSLSIDKHVGKDIGASFLGAQVQSGLKRTLDNVKKQRFALASKSLSDVMHACHHCHTQTNVPIRKVLPLKDRSAKTLTFSSRLLQIGHTDFAYATRRYDLGFSLDKKAILTGPELEVRPRFKRAFRTALVLLRDKKQSLSIIGALEKRLAGDDDELIKCLRDGVRKSKAKRSIESHIKYAIREGLENSTSAYDLCGFPYFAEASTMARAKMVNATAPEDKSKALFLYALSESLLDESNWAPIIDRSFIEAIELAPQLDESEYALAILRERAARSWGSVGFRGIPESTERMLMDLEALVLKHHQPK